MKLKKEIEMSIKGKTMKDKLKWNSKIEEQFIKIEKKLKNEIRALDQKQESFEKQMLLRVKKIKEMKKEIVKLNKRPKIAYKYSKGNYNGNDRLQRNSWNIDAKGMISNGNGTQIWGTIHDKNGFWGMLRDGDEIVLTSKQGFWHPYEEVLVVRVLIVNSENPKFNKKTGFVKLFDTSFYTMPR